MKTTAIVLAAGRSTRMNSKKPKVLHPLLGRPMAFYALEAAEQASGARPVAIIGHEAEIVRQSLGDKAETVLQEPQLGTGHAVRQAQALLDKRSDYILVTTADMPLLTGETLRGLVQAQQSTPDR
jgi:bifunctional UDP-N-acetylglucosamine pyrophosphorylase/glucosamine-1-phosphate N-acetyltransferase